MIPGQLPARNCLLPDLIPCAVSGNTPFLQPKEHLSPILGNLPRAGGSDLDPWGSQEGPRCDSVGSVLPWPSSSIASSPPHHNLVSLGCPHFPNPGMGQFVLAELPVSSSQVCRGAGELCGQCSSSSVGAVCVQYHGVLLPCHQSTAARNPAQGAALPPPSLGTQTGGGQVLWGMEKGTSVLWDVDCGCGTWRRDVPCCGSRKRDLQCCGTWMLPVGCGEGLFLAMGFRKGALSAVRCEDRMFLAVGHGGGVFSAAGHGEGMLLAVRCRSWL